MEEHLLEVFRRQALQCCEHIIISGDLIGMYLEKRDNRTVMFSVQALLNANANFSKICWGSGGRAADRRKPVRQSLGVADNSPLREVVMRNNFEHIDERIERWWAESPARNYVDNTIGRKNAIIGVGDIDTFRWFDPESGEIRFWGVGLNLVALIDEAERLLKRGKIL